MAITGINRQKDPIQERKQAEWDKVYAERQKKMAADMEAQKDPNYAANRAANTAPAEALRTNTRYGPGRGNTGTTIGAPTTINQPNVPQLMNASDDEATKERKKRLAELRAERNADMVIGRKRGEELFGEGSLGRVNAETSPEMQAILDQRKLQTEGFTPEEIEAQRSIYVTPAQQALQGQLRGMRSAQANSGVRGATASSQEGQIRTQFANQQAQLSQAQALADTEARRQALTGYQQALQGSEADRLGREQFNIAMKNREMLGILNTELGYGSLGVADRGFLNQNNIADMFQQETAPVEPEQVASGPAFPGPSQDEVDKPWYAPVVDTASWISENTFGALGL